VPSAKISRADLPGRVALLEAAAHRGVVVVVDDVATPDQVEPLLSARGQFALLMTSRWRLPLEQSVSLVDLDVLTPRQSVELLAAAFDDPASAMSDDAAVLAELTGHLPLALAVLVGRIRARPGWTLADHVDRLSELRRANRLDSVVDSSLRLSYDGLLPEERDLLRHLALHPTAEVSRHAAAALAGVTPSAVDPLLRGLLRANLLRSGGPDRYHLHDLVRTFARARALDEDSPSARQAALDRLYGYHQQATTVARARWSRKGIESEASTSSRVGLPELDTRAQALAWLTTERVNLLVTAHQAIQEGRADHAAAMSGLLFRFLEQENYAADAARLHRAVADATTGLDRARALNCLGVTDGTLGRWESARAAFGQALDLFAEAEDSDGIGWVVGNLGAVCWHLQDYAAALDYSQWSLRIAEEQLDSSGQAISLHNIALILDRLGRTADGLDHHRRALAITQQLGDLVGESRGLSSLGGALVRENRDEEARPLLLEALRTAKVAQSALAQCEALSQLAALSSRAGDHGEALATYRDALRLAKEDGRPDTVVEIGVDFGTGLIRAGQAADAVPVLRSALEGARELQDRHAEARATAELTRATALQEPRQPRRGNSGEGRAPEE
jgi:tetratricopeptide (TPR) repeat protein